MTNTGVAMEHPVLVREIVRRDGSRALALHVFCSQRGASVPLETCERCPSCVDIAPDEDGVGALVRCEPPALAPPRHAVEDVPGDSTPVGTVLRGGTLCIGADVEVQAVVTLLAERALPGLFVVDSDGRLVGVVRDDHLLRRLRPLREAGLVSWGPVFVGRVEAVMSTATSAGEGDSVRRAVVRMANARLREIPIVSSDGQLVGVLRDIDGLRWMAAERRAKR